MIDTELRTLFNELLQDETPPMPTIDEDLARGWRLRNRRRRRIAAAGIASAAAITLAAAVLPGSVMQGADVSLGPSTSTMTDADTNPFFLLDDPAWTMMRADLSDVKTAWYKRGSDRATIAWYHVEDPATSALAQNRRAGLAEIATTVLGSDASIFARDDGFELVWRDGTIELSVNAVIGSLDEMHGLAESLRQVDAETFLATGDDELHDNSAAIEEIASNVPVPDNFASLVEDRLNRFDPADEQGLTEGVMHWVACGWIREWVDAERSNDRNQIRTELSAVVDWAAEHDAITDATVWTSAQTIIDGETTVEGRTRTESVLDGVSCGGW